MIQMSARGDNSEVFESTNIIGGEAITPRQQVRNDSSTMLLSPEIFIGLELSIVPEVEQVYVDRIEDGKIMRVMVMVSERDPEVRRRIYVREEEIIDAHPDFEFDFYVHPLMGRPAAEVVDGIGKPAYKRFHR